MASECVSQTQNRLLRNTKERTLAVTSHLKPITGYPSVNNTSDLFFVLLHVSWIYDVLQCMCLDPNKMDMSPTEIAVQQWLTQQAASNVLIPSLALQHNLSLRI